MSPNGRFYQRVNLGLPRDEWKSCNKRTGRKHWIYITINQHKTHAVTTMKEQITSDPETI